LQCFCKNKYTRKLIFNRKFTFVEVLGSSFTSSLTSALLSFLLASDLANILAIADWGCFLPAGFDAVLPFDAVLGFWNEHILKL
jgi:hypothetical protein